MSLMVNEIYYSIQGESTHVGRPCIFIRLTYCNLRCTFCDTEYAFYEGRDMEISEIMDKTTITINTSDTSCSSGTFQFSADNFDTCLKNTGVTFTVSNSDKTFTAMIGFATSTTYKFRITSGATDLAGNSVSMSAISFTTQ